MKFFTKELYYLKITPMPILNIKKNKSSKNIFVPGCSDIESIVDAKVVITDTTPYDLIIE